VSSAIDAALAELGELGLRDVPIGPMTTCRVGGTAAIFVEANSVEHVDAVAGAVAASGLPLLTIGRGSNMLVSDSGFFGIAMVMGEGLATINLDPLDDQVVSAGGATLLPVLARRTVKEGLAGLEWAVGVPGTVGGAIRMNAGGHGADVKESLIDVVLFDISERQVHVVGNNGLGLRFRGSNLTSGQVVISARFGLERGEVAAGERVLTDIVRWRRDNQPGGQNAGSVFVNPFDGAESAGRLIDELGLKGFRLGSAQVSPKHANFIQVDDGGSADDVKSLMDNIVRRVDDSFGITLRSEIRLIGFGDTGSGDTGLGDRGPDKTMPGHNDEGRSE